jgi:hypothetical protein
MNLYEIRDEINEIVRKKQNEFQLTFEENSHIYQMIDLNGNLRCDFPSVSKVMKLFYDEFPTDEAAEKKSKGDPILKEQLIKEWAEAGTYSTNMGSRVHYLLEKESLEMFGIKKEVRQPIFECDFTQILKGDSMVHAGINFLKLMKERNALLMDTEIILGHPELFYTGQPDKVWIIENKDKNDFGFVITDYKTNKPKNFEENRFTKKMKPPFQQYPNNALGHYFTQLPFYGKLLLKMLEGSKYEKIKLYGGIIVHLKENGEYEEYRVPKEVTNTILNMDMCKYLTTKNK